MTKLILIVEDEPKNVTLLRDLLQVSRLKGFLDSTISESANSIE